MGSFRVESTSSGNIWNDASLLVACLLRSAMAAQHQPTLNRLPAELPVGALVVANSVRSTQMASSANGSKGSNDVFSWQAIPKDSAIRVSTEKFDREGKRLPHLRRILVICSKTLFATQ